MRPSSQSVVERAEQIQEPSIRVFRRFIVKAISNDGTVHIDAHQVVSKNCYEHWLGTRIGTTKDPERTFQRTLTAHLTGSDGRQPFLPEEEAAILNVVRVKSVWWVFWF